MSERLRRRNRGVPDPALGKPHRQTPPDPITFQPLTREDLPLLSRWLAPHVRAWWQGEAPNPHDPAVQAALGKELVVDHGTHTELVCAGGRYEQLHRTQSDQSTAVVTTL